MNTRAHVAVLTVLAVFGIAAGHQRAATQTLTITEGTSMSAALSPDAGSLAVDVLGSLWIVPVSGGAARRITAENLDARQPSWSPDGRQLVFQAYVYDTWDIFTIAADGSNLTQLTKEPFDEREPQWSPDGTRIVFSSDRNDTYDVFELTLASGAVRQITNGPANESMPCWSPDGREIAFVSDRQENPGIWTMRDGMERLVTAASGTVNAPSFSPDGKRVAFNLIGDNQSVLEIGNRRLTANEDVFPFRAQWISDEELIYTGDGHIKRRQLANGEVRTIDFRAEVPIARNSFVPRRREFPRKGPQPVRGIMGPAISPDGKQVAFAALGDLWIVTAGDRPQRLTHDPFVETDPAWSPDGRWLAFSSDRAGTMDVWLRDLRSGGERRLTDGAGAEMYSAWGPDSSRVAFVSADTVSIVNVQTRQIMKARDHLNEPGRPSWSSDGTRLLVPVLRTYSTRFREGTNQVLVISLDGAPDRYIAPIPHKSAGMREDYGPVLSPDGRVLAFINDGLLWTVPVGADLTPSGTPRVLSKELANAPAWTGDSRRLIYQATDGVRVVSAADGEIRRVPIDLSWTPTTPTDTLVVHAGQLFDGRTPQLRSDSDIVIDGNRITRVVAHDASLHSGRVVDASGLTVMPGLIEIHSHQSKEYGEALGRIWLSFGVTTVRNPAAHPFEAMEDREAIESGARIGPRVFTTGNPFDGTRIYYPGGSAIGSASAQLEMELDRARQLQFDLIKTYVRLPDTLQKRIIEFAHANGMPVTSHELYPAAAYGADGVEHIRGTSRRGYSPKVTALNRTYGDVIEVLAASGMTITPTVGIQGAFQLLTLRDPSWMDDSRMRLFPASVLRVARDYVERSKGVDLSARAEALAPLGRTVRAVVEAGGRVVAGTDAPIVPYGLSLHTELQHYVDGGLTPFQALQTATVVPAEALGSGADLGAIEPGKLADLVVIRGNPLADIKATLNLVRVVKDGVVYEMDALLRGPSRAAPSSAPPP
jgi:Tol biopolymer transport system component/imidazolonepropionase-like amidohydrolase